MSLLKASRSKNRIWSVSEIAQNDPFFEPEDAELRTFGQDGEKQAPIARLIQQDLYKYRVQSAHDPVDEHTEGTVADLERIQDTYWAYKAKMMVDGKLEIIHGDVAKL